MNIKQARAAIEAILAAIPDDEMPKFDKVEQRDGDVIVWWGGCGHHLGSAMSAGQREPNIHRRSGSWDAIEGEMVARADRVFLDNGDSAEGLKITGKRVSKR